MGGLNEFKKKQLIDSKVNETYMERGKYCQTKDEFKKKVEESFSNEHKRYIKASSILEHFNKSIDKKWELIDKNKNDELKREKEKKELTDQLSQTKESMKQLKKDQEEKDKEHKNYIQKLLNDHKEQFAKYQQDMTEEKKQFTEQIDKINKEHKEYIKNLI